jgi:hypothetical protein
MILIVLLVCPNSDALTLNTIYAIIVVLALCVQIILLDDLRLSSKSTIFPPANLTVEKWNKPDNSRSLFILISKFPLRPINLAGA